jgi:hypothetical protein
MCADGNRFPLGFLRIAGFQQERRIGLAAAKLLNAQRQTKALQVLCEIIAQAIDIERMSGTHRSHFNV